MFDLKGFRKDRKLSQKQISKILGIGTSFISQIETGKDPMPSYIPDKLANAYGRKEVDAYFKEGFSCSEFEAERRLHKKYTLQGGINSDVNNNGVALETGSCAVAPVDDLNAEWIDRILQALERRDELAFQQQKEYERQGERLDDFLSLLMQVRA